MSAAKESNNDKCNFTEKCISKYISFKQLHFFQHILYIFQACYKCKKTKQNPLDQKRLDFLSTLYLS